MLRTVQGVYRHGKVELEEAPETITDETRVLVTFLEASDVDLSQRGIQPGQAAELRQRLASFAEEWESEEMSIYDRYEEARAEAR